MTKTAVLNLGYFKQGEDLASLMADNGIQSALKKHAEMLDEAASQLRMVAKVLDDCGDEIRFVEVDASDHEIIITAPGDLIDAMVGVAISIIDMEQERE